MYIYIYKINFCIYIQEPKFAHMYIYIYIYICIVWLNQNLYVNNYFINLIKINEYFTFKLHNECMLCEIKVL